MSIDVLKNKIRKLKNPSAVTIAPSLDAVPEALRSQDAPIKAMGDYCVKVLEVLKGQLPAAKVSFGAFALYGPDGLAELKRVLDISAKLGYYTILEWQQLEEEWAAKAAAAVILNGQWKCDAVTICGYAGTGSIKPYIAQSREKKQDVYVVLKTGGKSGSELQDLQTGGRMVYTAGADLLTKLGEPVLDRCGYSRVAAQVSANHASSIRTLRQKYPKLFLLVDALESGNAKNASYAFDKMGHGALVCCDLLRAWQENPEQDPLEEIANAAQRMKRNVTAYVTIL